MGRLRSGGNGSGSSICGGGGGKRRLTSKGGAGSSIFSHGSSGRGRGIGGVAVAAPTGMGQQSSQAAMTGTLEQEGEAVASLQTLNANVLSAVLAFLLAHEAEQLAGTSRALRTQSGYRGFVPTFCLRAPGGSEVAAARAAMRRRRRLLEEEDRERGKGGEEDDRSGGKRRGAGTAALMATPPRPLLPPNPSPSSSLSSAHQHRHRHARTSSHNHHKKPPPPPYKKALATLRCYPRLESLHLDLRRLTCKDVMALVDKLPLTLRSLRISHSLPPPAPSSPHDDDNDGEGQPLTGINDDVMETASSHSSSTSSSTNAVVLPVGVTLLPSSSREEGEQEQAWAEEQEAAWATTATLTATVRMVTAYVRLAQSCTNLRTLSLPRQRVDVSTGTLPLLTAALASGCWPLLEELDVALDLLALDDFAGPGLLGEGSPRGLKALTLRLLFRPDQEDVDASVNGEGLARAFKEGRLRQLESLALLPDEIKFGEDGEEDGVEVADMVWVATDAFRPVFEAMVPPSSSSLSLLDASTDPTALPCPNLTSLALGEFISPAAFAACNRFLRSSSPLLANDGPSGPQPQPQQPLKHLRLGRLNGDELAAPLLEMAALVRDRHLSALETLHINDLSSTDRSRQGRVEPLRVIIEEGIKKRRSLPCLRDLSLRNTGATSADAEDIILHAPPTLASLSLGNESEILIYNFNCVGWPAMRTLRKVATATTTTPTSRPCLPALTTLNLHGNRLSAYGAMQLVAALVKGAMPQLRTLDLRGTHLGAPGLLHMMKVLSRPLPTTNPSDSGQQQPSQPTITITPPPSTSVLAPPPPTPLAATTAAASSLSIATTSTSSSTNSSTTRKRKRRVRLTMPPRRLPVRRRTVPNSSSSSSSSNSSSSGANVAVIGRSTIGRGANVVGEGAAVRTLSLRRLLVSVSGGGGGEEEEEAKAAAEQKRALLGLLESPALPHLTRLVVWDEDETLDADAVAALQGANPRVHVTVHARLVPTPAL